MSEKMQETIADIVAEMRRRKEMLEDAAFNAPLCYSTETMQAQCEILDEFVERFEAAHKHEVDKLNSVIQATVSRSDAEIDRLRREVEELMKTNGELATLIDQEKIPPIELSKNSSKNGADFGQFSDAAKLREAVVRVRDFADRIVEDRGLALAIINTCDAALAAPPRNCDTPYNDRVEMYGAFKDWCNARGHTMEPKLAYDAFEWLLAPATEKEGGAK